MSDTGETPTEWLRGMLATAEVIRAEAPTAVRCIRESIIAIHERDTWMPTIRGLLDLLPAPANTDEHGGPRDLVAEVRDLMTRCAELKRNDGPLHREIDSPLHALADIRAAAGDPEGCIMLSDLADHIAGIVAERNRLRTAVCRISKRRDEIDNEAFEYSEQVEGLRDELRKVTAERDHLRWRVAQLRAKAQKAARSIDVASAELDVAAQPEPGDRATNRETEGI